MTPLAVGPVFSFSSVFVLFCVSQDNEEGMEGDRHEEETVPETRIEVEIPKVSTDLGSDLYFVKLPNFLSVEPRSESIFGKKVESR